MNQAHKQELAWNQRITAARDRLGINKSEFARLVGVSTATTADWETGTIKMIDGNNLVKAAKVLRVSAEWLMDGSESTTNTVSHAERRLCTIWARPSITPGLSSWLDCSTELTDIGVVLASVGAEAEVIEMFHEAADIAFARLVYDIQDRRAA